MNTDNTARTAVKILTVFAVISAGLLTGCSQVPTSFDQVKASLDWERERCKQRPYVHRSIQDHLSKRFSSNAPVRMAIIPFSVPQNLTAQSDHSPGLGHRLAWKVHQHLLARNLVPIVEIFNREDWPRKTQEFFTGNFNAIKYSRDAGYDLVLVATLEPMTAVNIMTVHSKVIEAESGLTLWYGTTTITNDQNNYQRDPVYLWKFGRERPDHLRTDWTIEELAHCIADGIASEPY